MQYLKLLLCSGLLVSVSYSSEAQLLKKLKQKAENVAEKIVDKKIDEKINGKGNPGNNNPGGGTGPGMPGTGGSGGGRNNTSGEGLVTTPPDVQKFLTEAEDAFKKNGLSESRYSIQQAMLGVEMEIGKKILKNLPPKVKNLIKDSAEDKVTSSGWGWVGLMIQGAYKEGEQELRITIANNAAWMQAINMYLANGGYAQQSSGDQQNWKQTKLKGYRAVIEFDKSSGYKLSVPLGQTSMIIFEGINFKTEQEMMDACSVIDIDGIKKELGEK